MSIISIETAIQAPPEACFDLARDIDAHCRSTSRTHERAVAGVTNGMIGPGETVTFEAMHFGIKQRLTSKIMEFDRPHRFVDEMVRGPFKALRHVHEFEARDGGTLMRDVFTFHSPLGLLGKLADALFLKRYMHRFLMQRAIELKAMAEALEPGA